MKEQLSVKREKINKKKGLKDLTYFTEAYLGYKNNWHHREWYDILQDKTIQDPKLIDEDFTRKSLIPNTIGKKNLQIILEAPREHAKSTCHAVNYPLWKIYKNPNVRIIIVSETVTGAESFLREIKFHLEQNDKLIELKNLVPRYPEKWTDTQIIVSRDDFKLKDPTVVAVGVGGTILSRRCDIIIADDILSEKNTRTPEQREKIKKWFMETLLPVLKKGGILIVDGTVFYLGDLYDNLINEPSFDIRLRYKAIQDEKDIDPETKKPRMLWTEKWDYDSLMKRKGLMGSLAYNRQYQNTIISAETCPFQMEWIAEAKNKGRKMRLISRFDPVTYQFKNVIVMGGMDLAISQKETADYTVLLTIGGLENGTRVLLNVERGHFSPAEQRDLILNQFERFNHQRIVVENNAYQKTLEKDMIQYTAVPVTGYTTGGEKFSEDLGINSLAILFENGKFILPYDRSDPRTIKLVDILVDQMLKFPMGHTGDDLMALWFANTALRQIEMERIDDVSSLVGSM